MCESTCINQIILYFGWIVLIINWMVNSLNSVAYTWMEWSIWRSNVFPLFSIFKWCHSKLFTYNSNYWPQKRDSKEHKNNMKFDFTFAFQNSERFIRVLCFFIGKVTKSVCAWWNRKLLNTNWYPLFTWNEIEIYVI